MNLASEFWKNFVDLGGFRHGPLIESAIGQGVRFAREHVTVSFNAVIK